MARLTGAAISDGSCASMKQSKTGKAVPVSDAGTAYNSLYDPEKEGKTTADSIPPDTFVLFAGIGGAFAIREYLSRDESRRCIVAEAGYPAFRSVLEMVDISGILSDLRVTLMPDCTDAATAGILQNAYLPAIDGDFRLVPLRSWQNRFPGQFMLLETGIREAIENIRADFSVQAHFGRLWFRNCLQNLAFAGSIRPFMPRFDTTKIAVIAAAGPSLEDAVAGIKADRASFVIFATDTAFSTLEDSGIIADVFVSIDAQPVSSGHVMRPLPPSLTVFLDICGNPAIARQAEKSGCNLVFAAGGHPLARHAALFSPLPLLDTGSGTVTVAALDAARSLGFADVRLAGADFAYTGGKPYCRGTYLADTFGRESARLKPGETQYTALMFRSPVSRTASEGGFTYSTDTLDRYALACKTFRPQHRWSGEHFERFPAHAFFVEYRKSLVRLAETCGRNPARSDPALRSLLPLMAWNRVRKTRTGMRKDTADAINLALGLIAGYTGVS